MANALYDKGREAFLDGRISWSADTIKAALIKSAYVPDLSTHQYYSDLTPGSNVVGTPQVMDSKGVAAGVASAADVTFLEVAAGYTVGYLAIYKDTGVAGSSPLIALIDTTSTGVINIITNDSDVVVRWGAGPSKIFKL